MSRERVGATPRPAQGQDARLETRRGAPASQGTGAHQTEFGLDMKGTEVKCSYILFHSNVFLYLVENN